MDIFLFAVIAVVIFIRLREQFGKISEDDKKREENVKNFLEEYMGIKTQKKDNNIIDITATVKETKKEKSEKKEELFDKEIFLKGADRAVEIITQALSNSDLETLESLLSKNLFADFKKKIETAKAKSRVFKSSLIAINKKEIVNEQLKGAYIFVDIEFETEQINFIENQEGKVISGSKNEIENVKEIWSFRKEKSAENTAWKIVGITNIE